MNERIRELAIEAKRYADAIVDHGGGFHLAYTEKLAQLIVLECSSICYKTFDEGDIIALLLMDKFGVEE